MIFAQVDNILLEECWGKLLGQLLGIRPADPKRDNRAHIAKNRVGHQLVQLFNVLVRHNQAKAVLARLGEDIGKTGRGKILKFVHI